jgi:hypothetical protein
MAEVSKQGKVQAAVASVRTEQGHEEQSKAPINPLWRIDDTGGDFVQPKYSLVVIGKAVEPTEDSSMDTSETEDNPVTCVSRIVQLAKDAANSTKRSASRAQGIKRDTIFDRPVALSPVSFSIWGKGYPGGDHPLDPLVVTGYKDKASNNKTSLPLLKRRGRVRSAASCPSRFMSRSSHDRRNAGEKDGCKIASAQTCREAVYSDGKVSNKSRKFYAPETGSTVLQGLHKFTETTKTPSRFSSGRLSSAEKYSPYHPAYSEGTNSLYYTSESEASSEDDCNTLFAKNPTHLRQMKIEITRSKSADEAATLGPKCLYLLKSKHLPPLKSQHATLLGHGSSRNTFNSLETLASHRTSALTSEPLSSLPSLRPYELTAEAKQSEQTRIWKTANSIIQNAFYAYRSSLPTTRKHQKNPKVLYPFLVLVGRSSK